MTDVDRACNKAEHSSAKSIQKTTQELKSTPISVEVKAPDACPYYVGCFICNINPHAKTPLWMQERLRRSGIRPLHPVVDVTQYVMLELGQPLHAFDAHQIQGHIVVRKSHDQEQLTLLNGSTITLSPSSLVIADQNKPLALAGIMGGEQSAVHENTTSIFLESAFFTPQALAGVARSYGLLTDAAYRYERGVDPALPPRALERAIYLITQITGGIASQTISIQQPSHWFEVKKVSFRPAQFSKRLGLTLSALRMQQILEALGFKLHSIDGGPWKLEVPSYRFDIAIEEDIIEELIRIEGYDHLPAAETTAPLRMGQIHPIELIERKASQLLQHLGYKETINYSFVDPAVQSLLFPEQQALTLLNPISSELSQMRTSLWTGLIASMLYNVNRQQESMALFETGRIFEHSTNTHESPMLAGLLMGLKNPTTWGEKRSSFHFYDLKGDLEILFESLSLQSVQFISGHHPALHPGQTAALFMKEKQIGWCGALHPKLMQIFNVTHDVFLFECRLDVFNHVQPRLYQPISKYPKIRRDLAFIVDETVPFSEIEQIIRANTKGMLKAIHVFDVYVGAPIPKGKKSIAIALIIQREDKTLTDEEIQSFLSAIIKKLEEKLSITLRDGS